MMNFFVIKLIIIIFFLLISVAFFTLLERKVMASMQRRKGPNIIGYYGLLQPIADAIKIIVKEYIFPNLSNKFLFFFAPFISFLLSMLNWLILPFNKASVLIDLNVGLLYIFAISSLGVYGIILAGWSSNSKYAFLGSIRVVAQMISYEISMSLIILVVVIFGKSLNLTNIVESQYYVWLILPFFPLFLMFFISILAETNRAPFDLPEAEAELVSGYNVEYSSIGFLLFFITEYLNIILMSSLLVIFFLGGWLPFFYIFNFWFLGYF